MCKKRDHYEIYHENECIRLGWNYKPKVVCDLPLSRCHLCNDLSRKGKERYCSNIKSHLARHKQRAKAYRDLSERVTCKVMCKVLRQDGSVDQIPCRKSYADKDGLRKHLCGQDGVASGRAHDISAIKAAYPGVFALVARKKDCSRMVGLTRRKISHSQKNRVNKRILFEEIRNEREGSYGRKGKKIRRDHQAR